VSTVGLVRYLGARRATGWLTLRQGAAHEERRLAMEKGMFLLTASEREAARVAFFWPTGTFAFDPAIPDRPLARLPVPAFRLALDAVRARIREAPLEELIALISPDRAVRLAAAYAERARVLDLSAHEERMV